MKIGVSPYGSCRQAALEFFDAAVEVGIDTFWLGDGLFTRPDFPIWRGGLESMVELAWIAGRHPGVRVGVSAAVLPLRDIDWLVREASTLDRCTEGRFILGVSPGHWDDELEYRGFGAGSRGAIFRERLQQLRDGFGSAILSPGPLTPGGPPIWLAGARPTMRLAASLGLCFQRSRMLPGELAAEVELWRALGGGEFAHRIYVEFGSAFPDGVEVSRHALTGSAEEILAGFLAYRDLGLTDLSLILGHDDGSAMATLSALADEVLPALTRVEEPSVG